MLKNQVLWKKKQVFLINIGRGRSKNKKSATKSNSKDELLSEPAEDGPRRRTLRSRSRQSYTE